MGHAVRYKKILKPDVPPPTINPSRQGLVVAGISALCLTGVIVAVLLFVFGS